MQRNRQLLAAMEESYQRVMKDPNNILRPWAMDPEKDHTLTCPTCLGVADYWPDEEAFVCRRCGSKAPLKGLRPDGIAAAAAG